MKLTLRMCIDLTCHCFHIWETNKTHRLRCHHCEHEASGDMTKGMVIGDLMS